MKAAFAERVSDAIRDKGAPICVGLDPRFDLLPPELCAGGTGFAAKAAAFASFCREVIDAVAPLVPAVKPQAAFFEPLLGPGVDAYAAVCRYARARGLVVIADVKRGDIGSTAEAYAKAVFDPEDGGGPIADACTVNPWFGTDGVQPFIAAARAAAGGIFVLVRTSNPTAGEIQDLTTPEGPVHEQVAALVRRWNEPWIGPSGFGPIGAVVGATRPDRVAALRTRLPGSILLLPGFGAQGAGAEDVAAAIDARGQGALVTASRSVTFPWAGASGIPRNWRAAIVDAVVRMKAALAGVRARA